MKMIKWMNEWIEPFSRKCFIVCRDLFLIRLKHFDCHYSTMSKLKHCVKWIAGIMHTHYSSYTSRQRPHQTRLLVWQMAYLLLTLTKDQKKKHICSSPWVHNIALHSLLNFSHVLVICCCQKLLFRKKGVQFKEKDTLIMGVRDKAPSSHYGICSNTITHPLTKIFRLDNGAMKSCSTMHNCSFWNIDELN